MRTWRVRKIRKLKNWQPHLLGKNSNGTPSDDRVKADDGFEGDTIQDAQDKIISELIHLKDSQ